MSGAGPATPTGQESLSSDATLFNSVQFMIRQLIGRIGTATVGMVTAVSNAGAVAPVGTVDIQPLVNQVDGAGNATAHGILHRIPYMRLQGGRNAVIIDPEVGDIGIVVFASRDISAVKASRRRSTPGSRRRNDMADGLYIGGVLNGVPSQYIQFSGAGITITAPAAVTEQTPSVITTGNLIVGTGATGTFSTSTGSVVTVADGVIINIS